jgi:lipoate-protein ligase A
MTETWRLIDTGPADPAINMAVDEAISQSCREGQGPTTLRFYTWRPAALSIGYFQNASAEIDLEQCKAQGYGFVRRLTGGKSVLHDQELTYSVMARANNPLFPKDLHRSFMVIAQALISGLDYLGIQAEVFGQISTKKQRRSQQISPSCFASAMGFEIGVDGKKLIGSAQRRWRDGFLQHGSILCHFDPEQLFNLLKFSDESERTQAIAITAKTVTSLSSILQDHPDIHQIKKGLIQGFENALKIRLMPSELTPYERDLAQTLAREKYGTDDWNLYRHQIPRE